MGYLCWDRNKALQRQSCKCSSKKAQERKESSREKQEGIRRKKKKESKEGGTEFTPFSPWGNKPMFPPVTIQEYARLLMAKQLKSRLKGLVSDCQAISNISSFSAKYLQKAC